MKNRCFRCLTHSEPVIPAVHSTYTPFSDKIATRSLLQLSSGPLPHGQRDRKSTLTPTRRCHAYLTMKRSLTSSGNSLILNSRWIRLVLIWYNGPSGCSLVLEAAQKAGAVPPSCQREAPERSSFHAWNMTLASWHHALGTHRTTSRGGGTSLSVLTMERETKRSSGGMGSQTKSLQDPRSICRTWRMRLGKGRRRGRMCLL
mmetsp:Transcript_59342/g.139762  ORF Transcript_59342/g.139762 Transcript_59342/m.139762 type:complete len:202 (+) Transcript_59342:778-1383(+)